MNAPIIFIHYGDDDYLRFTLHAAKLFNPDKNVVLLGDQANSIYKPLGINHVPFQEFDTGEDIREFDNVFQVIAGADFTRVDWLRFVFKRWFLIKNFLYSQGYSSFWTFDSDNLLFDSLARHEAKFADYDCTEQCNGLCMNGFIRNRSIVDGYLRKIIALFKDPDKIIRRYSEEYSRNPIAAFTEMAAYDWFREDGGFKSIKLSSIINDETFDDALSLSHEMEMADQGHKRLYLNERGLIFTKHLPSQRFVRLISANMSWLHSSVVALLYYHSLKGLRE